MSSVSITRLYKAINKSDPDGKYLWYVIPNGIDISVEAQGVCNSVAYQASNEIYGHLSDYNKVTDRIMKKMEAVTKVLETETDKE